ncbi:MAG: MATE family efflux transporter [Lachnospiraceae bacterium]|nr:MATE family efflux transporter [Lachnospiraceae bacterium]
MSLLVNSLYNMVDQVFIGRGVGYLGNGATNIIYPLTVIVLSVALMLGDGGASFLSIKLGEDRKEEATKGIANAILFSVIAGIALAVLIGIFLDKLVFLFGCTDTLFPYAMDYGRIITIGLPFVLVGTVFTAIERADGSPKYSMASLIAGAVVNTILDPLFIFKFHWGVQGAAIATIIGQILTCCMGLLYIRKFKTISPKKSDYALKWKYCKNVLSLGVSSFITQISIVIVMAVVNNLLTKYGADSVYGSEIPIAVVGIVMKVNQLVISAMVGIASGAQPIIGFNYGAQNYERVKKVFGAVVICAEILAVVAFALYQLIPVQIISIFGKESALYNEFAEKCFRIYLLATVLNGFQTVSGLFMQSIGKPVHATWISLSRQIIFFIPAQFILSAVFGLMGVLWATPIADTLAFILALILTIRESRRLKPVPGKFGKETAE